MNTPTVTIRNGIFLQYFPVPVLKRVQDKLSVRNEAYYLVMRKTGRHPYGIDPLIRFYTMHGNVMQIPRGMEDTLLNYLEKIGLEYKLERRTISKTLSFTPKLVGLRDYQKPLVDAAVECGKGLFVAGTGTGKGVMLVDIIARLGKTATILVPKLTLAEQIRMEIKTHWGYDCGMIQGKEKTIKEVTVATYQSLSNNKELLDQLVQNTSTLICDEAQGWVSPSAMKVFNAFAPEHFYGMTASPDRDDSRADGVYFLFGEDPVVEYHKTQMKPIVEVYQTGAKIEPSFEYHEMVENMVEHESRNKLIAGLIGGAAWEGRKVLVLTKRIAHYEKFREMFPPSEAFRYIESSDKDRDQTLMRMKKGLEEFSVIFGTTSLLSVGVDIPELDTVIIACDMKGKVLTTQSAGRILRSFSGKKQPVIVDLHDGYKWNFEMKNAGLQGDVTNYTFHKQFQERLRLYKSKGWTVEYKGGILPYKLLHDQDD